METAKQLDIPVFIHCAHPPYSLPWSIALFHYPTVEIQKVLHVG